MIGYTEHREILRKLEKQKKARENRPWNQPSQEHHPYCHYRTMVLCFGTTTVAGSGHGL